MFWYVTIISFSCATALVICTITFIRRNILGAKPLFLLGLALAFYSFGYLFEILSPTIESKFLYYRIEYFGIATIPFLWLFFSLQYSDYNYVISTRRIFVFLIVPIITIIMVWTNKYHNFMIKVVGISTEGVVHEILKINGPWYWVNAIYSYILIGIGSILLLNSISNLPSLYISQGLVLVLGALVPLIASVLYIFKLFPIKSFDFNPFAHSISGILLTYSLFKVKTFQVIPIIRDRVFESMKDGYIIVDRNGKIVDANKSAQNLLKFNLKKVLGKDIIRFFKDISLIENLYTYRGDKLHYLTEYDFSNWYEDDNIQITSSNSVGKNDFSDYLFRSGTEEGYYYDFQLNRKGNKDSFSSLDLDDISTFIKTFKDNNRSSEKLTNEDLISVFRKENQVLIIKIDSSERYFSIFAIPVEKRNNILAGYLILLHDETKIKIMFQRLENSMRKIESLNLLIYELSKSETESDIFSKISEFAIDALGFEITSFFAFESGTFKKKFISNLALESFDVVISKIFEIETFNNELLEIYEARRSRVLDLSKFVGESVSFSQVLQNIRFAFLTPIEDAGIFMFLCKDEKLIDEEVKEIINLVLKQSLIAFKRVWLQEVLKKEAEIDPLTGVYNRRYFYSYIEKELERARRHNYSVAFLMIDIDKFKMINDKYGHQAGDLILKSIGNILVEQTRKIDIVVRYGGDEFLLVLPAFARNRIEAFKERINRAVTRWGSEVKILNFDSIELSIGIAYWDPGEERSIEEVINEADFLMYKEKKEKYKSVGGK
ncbi:MAG: diguanylate cyclase [Actinobacteria bacterium]|nr:diguanylate cyclase [Actinomycetota bacterium]